jgi:hypothetical protein
MSIWWIPATPTIIGYPQGSTWHRIITTFSNVGYVAAALAVGAVLLLVVHRLRTLRAERDLNPVENS